METLLYHNTGVSRKYRIKWFLLIFLTFFVLSCSNEKIESGDKFVVFSDYVEISDNETIQFLRQYILEHPNIPFVVGYFNVYPDSITLTVTGYQTVSDIFGTPSGYLKVGNKTVLFDFGWEKIIDRKKCYVSLFDKLQIDYNENEPKANQRHISYFYPAWKIVIDRDGKSTIIRGVRPPDAPPEPKPTDSIRKKILFKPH